MFIRFLCVSLFLFSESLAGYGFSLPSFNGSGNVSFPTGSVTIVDFWASWCGPCKASFSHYNKIISKFGGKVRIIGINEDKEKDAASKFLTSTPANFTLAWDKDGSVYSQYGVGTMPTAYLFDKSGSLHKTYNGFTSGTGDQMEKDIEELLK